jgi:hypothetical protein
MHSNDEYMHSYLSYVDTKSKKLSMVLFDSVKFFPLNGIKKSKKQILLNYSTNELRVNDKKTRLEDLNSELLKYQDSTITKIKLVFNKEITYNNYIELKATLQQLKNNFVMDWHEYYY